MNRNRLRRGSDSTEYSAVRRRILERDGWRCQACGARHKLQVHHREFRSRGGSDQEENLVTLCNTCHDEVHRRPRAAAETADELPRDDIDHFV